MKIGIGSHHNVYEMKNVINHYVESLGLKIVDYGNKDNISENDYPQVAFDVAEDINSQVIDRGILICGTGIGVGIAACKIGLKRLVYSPQPRKRAKTWHFT